MGLTLPVATGVSPTYGWDTVSAVMVADMNGAIVAAKSTPPGFSQAVSGTDANVTASFGDWQIDDGGDGRLIHFAIPLRNATARYESSNWTGNATARVEVQLQFVPHTQPQPAGGILHDLVVNTAPPSTGTPIATVLSVVADAGAPPLGAMILAAIKLGLQQWLCANLDQFAHVFATVNLAQAVGGDQAWLKPTYATYVFQSRPGAGNSIFAILCQTEGRPVGALIEQLSPFAIPVGARAGFLMSPDRVLSDLLAQSLPSALPGLAAADIHVDLTKLELKTLKPAALKPVVQDGHQLYPSLDKLVVDLKDQVLVLTSTVSTPIVPGIRSVGVSTGYYTIVLGTLPNGSHTLRYNETQPASQQHYTEESTGMEVLSWMLLIGAAIASIALFWTGFVVALVIAAILMLGALLAIKAVEYVNEDNAPSIDAFINAATQPIMWTHGSTFSLTSAALNGALQIGGALTNPAPAL